MVIEGIDLRAAADAALSAGGWIAAGALHNPEWTAILAWTLGTVLIAMISRRWERQGESIPPSLRQPRDYDRELELGQPGLGGASASKEIRRPVVPLRLPPISWRVEWERATGTANQAGPGQAIAPQDLSGGPRLVLLGAPRIIVDGVDHAPALLRRPVQSFFWLYLVAREIGRPGDRITRAALADELFPGLDPESQRGRFRRRLSDVLNDLPPSLARCVWVEGEYLGLDLRGWTVDVRELFDLASTAERSQPLPAIPPDTVAASLRGDEFLAGWEEVERRVTGGRGIAGSVVAQVREQTTSSRIRLLSCLVDDHLRHDRQEEAMRLLAWGLGRWSDSEILLRLHQQTGNPVRRSFPGHPASAGL
jgi:hypothetical protein